MPPAQVTVPAGSELIPPGQRDTWILLGVFGNWLTEPFMASEALRVRTVFPSTSQVRESGCQSICTICEIEITVAFIRLLAV